eukprot:CAMPEP_0169317560 /NCGR_PEP_ID=MMETSP1017-20121227/6786_1 /TAXON_ID=342587 /ORGANISM="Karlodinium micrum, Strain CCMP2283" /LENGTH=171 /DNA_ID=CAMNT_0009411713 /DNA_START=134 /DNA_END=650 /DNA_ORIENTATION=+
MQAWKLIGAALLTQSSLDTVFMVGICVKSAWDCAHLFRNPGKQKKNSNMFPQASPSQSSDVARLLSAEEASPKPTERHRADLSRKSCACAKGEAPHRLFWRSPVTTAYGGPAPSPKLPEGPANKANELVKRWEEKENDLAQTLKNGQQSKHVVVENVKAAAYSRAPAKTVY